MKRVLPSLFFTIVFFLASCTRDNFEFYPFYYTVTNNSGFEIRVEYAFNFYYNYSGLKPDSVIQVDPGREKTLYVVLMSPSRYSDRNPETKETLNNIRKLEVFKDDSVRSDSNFLLTKFWKYSTHDGNKGELNLVVSDKDFDK